MLVMLFFYSMAFIKGKLYFKILLMVASLTAPYMGILDGGRTNMIYWLLFAVVSFVIFRPYLNFGKSLKTYLLLAIPIVIIGALFIMASVDRFENREGGTEGGLVSYAGQSFVNFGDFIEHFDGPTYTLKRIFPRLSTLFSKPFNLEEYRNYVMNRSHMDIGIFYTLLGDLYVDIGLIGMFIYVLLYRRICKGAFRKSSFGVSDIILLSLLLQIPVHGLFYYSLWTIKASNTIIITILLYFYFKSFRKRTISQ